MRSPMARAVLIFGVLAALTVGVAIYQIVGQHRVSCEVCITFRDRTACREALGPTREEAIRTATDNACAFLAAGMSASIACTNTPPASVDCDGSA